MTEKLSLCNVAFLCVVELLNQKVVLPLAVDVHEEERAGDVNVRLSSLRISPISNDDVSKVGLHDNAVLTDAETEPGHGYIDQSVPAVEYCEVDCGETNGKVAIDVDDIFVNASNAESLLSSSRENPVTNLA